jgi:hypothetical protein
VLCCRSDRVYMACDAFCENDICALYSAVPCHLGVMKCPEGDIQRDILRIIDILEITIWRVSSGDLVLLELHWAHTA